MVEMAHNNICAVIDAIFCCRSFKIGQMKRPSEVTPAETNDNKIAGFACLTDVLLQEF